MPYQTSTKPVVDAVNDAVSALTDLVRSLRATAKAAKKSNSKEAKRKGGKAKDLKTRFERAWEVFAHGKAESANGSGDGASRARPARRAVRGGARGRTQRRGVRTRGASTSGQPQQA